MRVAIYRSKANKLGVTVASALASGFTARGDEVDIVESRHFRVVDDWTQMACVIGLMDRNIYDAHLRAGKHVLLVDEGYINPKRYFRLALDGYQSRFIHHKAHSSDRLLTILSDIGTTVQKARTTGYPQNILYIGSTQAYCDWHKLGPLHQFDSNICRKLAFYMPDKTAKHKYLVIWKLVDTPVGPPPYPHRHTSLVNIDTPIESLFRSVSAVATHGNHAAVTALLAGIPTIICSEPGISPIYSISETDISKLETPYWPSDEDRIRILSNIAWCQFTLEEIASGFALKTLEPHTIKRLEFGMPGVDPNNLDYLIAQYQLMHENEKRYRGGLLPDVVEEIAKMMHYHEAVTLLDYGSGKGRQYEELQQHHAWGGSQPTCYDPAYPPFSQKPTGQFDGVICTDVAEHIPTDKIYSFLKVVISYARKFVVFCIFTGLAGKTLPDGRNAHLTVRPPEWWIKAICLILIEQEYPVTVTKTGEETYVLSSNGLDIVIVFRLKE